MQRRTFLGSLGAATAARAWQPAPMNIVFILADDLGWSDLACYGADLHETPNIDRLAAEGVRFTDAHSASPVCTPTRASIMTGKHPARLGMTIWYESTATPPQDRKLIPPVVRGNLPLEEKTIAEICKERGYLTAAVGKWHLGDANHYPETQGFDINIGGSHWGAPETYYYPYRGMHRFREFRYMPRLDMGKPGEYLTDRLTDEALRVIDYAGNLPFFLYLAHHAPHTPIEAPAALVEHYQRKLRPEMKHQNPVTAAMIHNLDQNVGRVAARLREKELLDRTLIVFTSDNGGYTAPFAGKQVTSNSPLRSGKGSAYEGGVRVPLIARMPGGRRGVTCSQPTISTDLFATMQEIAGASGPVHDGVSLAPLLRNENAPFAERELYFHYPHYYVTTSPVSAIRSGPWKLLHYFEDDQVELFRLDRDLAESQDLVSQEPGTAARLKRKLGEWLKSVNAPMPAKNPKWVPKPGA
ncbi:MAG: sulfatase [Bryobacterales bacterium]|nr:sulfatase [Bryobacterales bacterium]